jgi:HNH endonuclease
MPQLSGVQAVDVDRDDKKRLMSFAKSFMEGLKGKDQSESLVFDSATRPKEVGTDGWCVQVAALGSGLPTIQIWLDRLNGEDERYLWLGFVARNLPIISKVIAVYSGRVSFREIRDADVDKKSDYRKLKNPLNSNDTKNPIQESYYREREFYFGIFFLEKKIDQRKSIQRALDFVVPIIQHLEVAYCPPFAPGERELIKRLVRDRQAQFRRAILEAYGGKCALTGCNVRECLEAAHIDRFSDSYDDSLTNGILLRADLHRLLDAGFMTFRWSNGELTANISCSVKDKEYRKLDNYPVNLPKSRSCWPSEESIRRNASRLHQR